MKADRTNSVLLVIDMQPAFMGGIVEADRVSRRAEFLAACAQLMEIPVFATEQNRERMGGSAAWVAPCLTEEPHDKMQFSAFVPLVQAAIEATNRTQVMLVGIESHICVTQTALDLIEDGYYVHIAEDAVSARSQRAHEIAMRRLEKAGCEITHTESVVYEWMQTASAPEFRAVLAKVKQCADG